MHPSKSRAPPCLTELDAGRPVRGQAVHQGKPPAHPPEERVRQIDRQTGWGLKPVGDQISIFNDFGVMCGTQFETDEGIIDNVSYATAQRYSATLRTHDEQIQNFPGAKSTPKRSQYGLCTNNGLRGGCLQFRAVRMDGLRPLATARWRSGGRDQPRSWQAVNILIQKMAGFDRRWNETR